MHVFSTISQKIILAVTAFAMALIIFCHSTDIYYSYITANVPHLTWFLLSCSLLLGVFFLLIIMQIKKRSVTQLRKFTLLCFILMICIQLFLICVVYRYALPWSDSLSVINEASRLSVMDKPLISSAGGYFEMYGNNYMIVILLSVYYRFLHLFGCSSYWIEAVALNMLLMDLGVWFGYRICMQFSRSSGYPVIGAYYALICLTCPVFYLFLPFAYTNTMSFFFMTGFWYYALKAFAGIFSENTSVLMGDSNLRVIGSTIAASVLLVIGFRLRPTIVILAIALFIYAVFAQIRQKSLKVSFTSRKRQLAAFLASCILLWILSGIMINHYVPEDIKVRNFPVQHWIMMGLDGDGGYNKEDEIYTASFATKTEKITADTDRIHERLSLLSQEGVGKIVSFLYEKFCKTWDGSQCDGLFVETGRMQSYTSLTNYLYGYRNSYVLIFYQCYKILLYLVCLTAAIRELARREWTRNSLYLLTLFGFFLFYLIWEANFRYSITAMPVLLLLAASELTHLSERKLSIGLLAIVWIPMCVFLLSGKTIFTQEPMDKQDIIISMVGRSYHENEIRAEQIVQTFRTDHAFNRIGFYVKDSGESCDRNYLVALLDDSDTILYADSFTGESHGKRYQVFDLPDAIYPQGISEYKIRIEGPVDGPVSLLYFDFPAYDYMTSGTLYSNGEDLHRDLIFLVTNEYSGAYTTPARYTLFAVVFMGLALAAGVFLFLSGYSKSQGKLL